MKKSLKISTNKQTEMNKEYSGKNELFLIENNLRNYNLFIYREIFKNYKANSSVLEFGAGIGTLAKFWSKKNKPDCLEIDIALGQILKKRGFNNYLSIKSIKKTYDFIYSSNVLEHIKNDLEALNQLNKLLSKKGLLILYVPAFKLLYSDLDRTVGHYRRYEKKELIQKLYASNYKIIHCYYSDSIGFFASLFLKYFGNKNGISLNNEKALKFYDDYIFPLSKILDQIGLKKILGKNLFIVAKKI
ncbi:BioC, biotin biosynthesis protein BioC [Candidatus Methylopumilus universalis]